MKKSLCFSAVILALALVCNDSSAQDNPLFRHISPDANSVYHINLPLLLSKVSLSDMMARIPAGKHGKSKNQEMMEFLKNPSMTGVDINGDVLITSSNPDFRDSATYTTLILHLTDTSKFRIALRKQSTGIRITRYPDKSYSAHKDKMAIAWDKDLAVIMMVTAPMKSMMPYVPDMYKMDGSKKEPGTTTPKPAIPNYAALAVPKAQAALKGWASSPIGDDPAFRTAFSDNSDFQMYTAKSNYYKALAKILPHKALGGVNLDSLSMYKSSITTLRFDNGKITMQTNAELLPQVAADMAKFPPPPSNEDLLARLPKNQLLGFVSMRFNLHIIGYLLDRIGMHSKADSLLATKKLSLDDLCNALKGDILVALLAPAHTDSFARPTPSFYAITSIGDITAFGKLADMMKAAKDSTGDDSTGKKATMMGKLKNNMALKDNILVISGSKAAAEGYFTTTEKRGNDELTQDIKEHQTYLWVDMQAIVNLLMGPVRSDEGADKKTKMLNGLHMLDKMIMKGGGLHDGKISSSFEISVTNKDQNVLKTLFDLIPTQEPKK
jgi:Domain of unknown function (DUF4836)